MEKKKIFFLGVTFVLTLLFASSCASFLEPDIEIIFSGTVVMSDNGDPGGATVRVDDQDGKTTTTDSGGGFSLKGNVVGSAIITLKFSKIGYQTETRTERVGRVTEGSGDDETTVTRDNINIGTIILNPSS